MSCPLCRQPYAMREISLVNTSRIAGITMLGEVNADVDVHSAGDASNDDVIDAVGAPQRPDNDEDNTNSNDNDDDNDKDEDSNSFRMSKNIVDEEHKSLNE